MVDSGSYDHNSSNKACPPPQNSQTVNSGGEYETSGSGASDAPDVEITEANDGGAYESESGEAAVCPPITGKQTPNDGGAWDTNENNGGQPCPPKNEDHSDDCDCDECCFYTESDPNTIDLGGHSKGETYNKVPMRDMWYQALHPYVKPAISLSGVPSPGYREKGIIINSVNLSALTVKNNLNISAVTFLRDGNLIHTESSPNPNGGTEVYLEETDLGTGLNPSDVNFTSTVGDGTSVVTSNKIWYRFVYPFYVGSLVSTTPTEAQVKALSKIVSPKQNISHVFNFEQERYVFAYPESYGTLESILDTNSFETIDDYVLQVNSYTMLDGNNVNYNVYVFNPYNSGLLTDAVNFTNTFIF